MSYEQFIHGMREILTRHPGSGPERDVLVESIDLVCRINGWNKAHARTDVLDHRVDLEWKF